MTSRFTKLPFLLILLRIFLFEVSFLWFIYPFLAVAELIILTSFPHVLFWPFLVPFYVIFPFVGQVYLVVLFSCSRFILEEQMLNLTFLVLIFLPPTVLLLQFIATQVSLTQVFLAPVFLFL